MFESALKEFQIPEEQTYLNCAYMSPLVKSVEEAGMQGMIKKRNPGIITTDDFFEEGDLLREEFAKLIRADEPKRIAIIPSASYGLATVAKNIKLLKGDNIVMAAEQFPSNYYSWQKA
ncbi:hypothetical protein LVD15_08240 [Fulvivirga maritima]|uniref:hypothetical protein n=1 Tax=Fulvivirga maritima TaxID=2904247 RepID=UPI001F368A1B|nr:hypothetical protein [Fulvivirga maritima]UII28405.1 hypothetical protein LVD15_08240 [Fulvivirga maritima]